MSLRKKLILNSYIESGISRNEIIIDDREYFITEKLRKKLSLRKNIIFIEVIVCGLVYKYLLENGLRSLIPNKFITAILFLLVGMSIVLFTSSRILGEEIEAEIIPKER